MPLPPLLRRRSRPRFRAGPPVGASSRKVAVVSVNAEDPNAPVLPSLTAAAPKAAAERTAVGVLLAISAAHLLNDSVQSLIPAI